MDITTLFTGANAIDITKVFKPLFDVIPYVLPGVLTIVGIRKGIGFIMSQIHGA